MKPKEPKFKLGPIQRAWVKALRSGKYKQTKNVLTEIENDKIVGHCCLGVLCNLAIKKGVKLKTSQTQEKHVTCLTYGENFEELPIKVMRWAGLRDNLGDYDACAENLAGINDSGASFAQIAGVIEENAAEIFTEAK